MAAESAPSAYDTELRFRQQGEWVDFIWRSLGNLNELMPRASPRLENDAIRLFHLLLVFISLPTYDLAKTRLTHKDDLAQPFTYWAIEMLPKLGSAADTLAVQPVAVELLDFLLRKIQQTVTVESPAKDDYICRLTAAFIDAWSIETALRLIPELLMNAKLFCLVRPTLENFKCGLACSTVSDNAAEVYQSALSLLHRIPVDERQPCIKMAISRLLACPPAAPGPLSRYWLDVVQKMAGAVTAAPETLQLEDLNKLYKDLMSADADAAADAEIVAEYNARRAAARPQPTVAAARPQPTVAAARPQPTVAAAHHCELHGPNATHDTAACRALHQRLSRLVATVAHLDKDTSARHPRRRVRSEGQP
jgi:hypothetical protein